ncbi:hypothetical protein [Clostridium tagluense]|uniref:hypothetical protein n=1 Tax=Clostridium tagluense TaxID=360422 RepID=UPI001CF18B06|nr:hypothetical protein [Clostridium tagluense]MCB2299094.1 hypothetical protein [Clostridium tagluense]
MKINMYLILLWSISSKIKLKNKGTVIISSGFLLLTLQSDEDSSAQSTPKNLCE